jgi:RNase H-like domain found in reverse transcriptase
MARLLRCVQRTDGSGPARRPQHETNCRGRPHIQRTGERAVAKVLHAFDRHDISVNLAKVQYCQQEVKFGGFLVQQGHYIIDPTLMDDLRRFPAPHNCTTLRSFLGLAQQFGNFTPELTKLTEPLRNLNTDKHAYIWLPQHQAAFEATQKTLTKPAYLAFFDCTWETKLLTDASRSHGLGFLLCQKDKDGTWRTVQCGSRTLVKHEANWGGMCELKTLTVAWAVRKCSYFLDGAPHFTVMTDSAPLIPTLND